jgi:hypothetical protein
VNAEERSAHRLRGREPDLKSDGGHGLVALGEEATGSRHPNQFEKPGGRALQVASEQTVQVAMADMRPLRQRGHRVVAGGIGGDGGDDGGHY